MTFSSMFGHRAASFEVQIWTVPHIRALNLELDQHGRYPTSGRVLAASPIATITFNEESPWDDLLVRIQEASNLENDLDGYVLLDMQGRFAQLGSENSSGWRQCLSIPTTRLVRCKDIHAMQRTLSGRISKQLSDSSGLLASGVQVAIAAGVARLLIAPKPAEGCNDYIFVWLKAFVPDLQLIGGFLLSPRESLHVGCMSGLSQMEMAPSMDTWGLLNEELQWWREEDSRRTLEPLDAGLLVGLIGLRPGQILLAHKANSASSCEVLYAQTREERSIVLASPQFKADLPTWRFSIGVTDAGTCQICLETFSPGELLTALPCTHVFHCQCLNTWLNRSYACPICRNVM